MTETLQTNGAQRKAPEVRRVFGYFEVVFDALYLIAAAVIGFFILKNAAAAAQTLAGVAALVLAGGDLFHLAPRIAAVLTGSDAKIQKALGAGKLITSVTMTAFYLLLWHIGLLLFAPAVSAGWTALVYALAAVRVALCCFPQNRWFEAAPPVKWGVYRNVPFALLGAVVAVLYGTSAQAFPALRLMWLAVTLSFAFYLPVVLWANKNRRLGMLMLPKTGMYMWILCMLASLSP
ncbi:MAG: hypothetical protein LBS36_01955 [Oscillospiraceae bacterium]|nr:hypothetical protein [Oscillospiraceae bacterium]